ncbi:MAG TPA: siderophore-interacting protein [Myxococcota bacterium]|nr:siderophore-interacting protein [Myxococcota bacterium]
MSSLKGQILNLFGKSFLAKATVLSVEDVGPLYRRLRLSTDLKKEGAYQPGDKIQILLPSLDVRTYTPVGWSAEGETEILVFRHTPGSPAGVWAAEVKVGDHFSFAGPQRSLNIPSGPALLVGDETSIAVAAAYTRHRPGLVASILEVGEESAARDAAKALGLAQATVVGRGDAPGLSSAILESWRAAPQVSVGLTGSGSLVQRAREVLREHGGPSPRIKAYWVPGKTGLD